MNGNNTGFLIRKLIHLAFSLVLLWGTHLFEKKIFVMILLLCFLAGSLWEVLRLKQPAHLPIFLHFKPLLKGRESKSLTDAWFYLLGILIASLFLWDALLRALILILGISDTVASLAGQALKGPKIFRGKTLYGSLSFFVSTILIFYFLGFIKIFGLSQTFVFSVLLTLSEALFERDNLSIPLTYLLYIFCLRFEIFKI